MHVAEAEALLIFIGLIGTTESRALLQSLIAEVS
jgi:hypothetical protein